MLIKITILVCVVSQCCKCGIKIKRCRLYSWIFPSAVNQRNQKSKQLPYTGRLFIP